MRISSRACFVFAAIGLGAASLFTPGTAEATVCNYDPAPIIGVPVAASFHLGSLLPTSIGLGTSKGSQGWRTATYITVPFNLVSSAALLAADASLGGDACSSASGIEAIHPATWISESVFTAWSASVLITALVLESDEPLPVSGYVAPIREGVIAGVGFSF